MQDQQLSVDTLASSSSSSAGSSPPSAVVNPNGMMPASGLLLSASSCSAAGDTVASRLKKMVNACNGDSSSRCENGYSLWSSSSAPSVSVVRPVRTDFSKTDMEMIRIIAQYMNSLGLSETVKVLTMESGCTVENPMASKFREDIMNGNWDSALHLMRKLQLHLSDPQHLVDMQFLICEQKYMELFKDGRSIDALTVLRKELMPLNNDPAKLRHLSCLLMNYGDAPFASSRDGVLAARTALMDKLQAYLPPAIILPQRRLETLIHQAIELQWTKCRFHNIGGQPPMSMAAGLDSLLVDHVCSSSAFPAETVQILSDHCDEVWFCSFSNGGHQLATGSKDGVVIIWDVDLNSKRLTRRFTLEGHVYGASYFTWSPNDSLLAVVGSEESSDLWIWKLEDGSLLKKFSHSPDESISCVSWHVDGQRLVCGGTKGQFYLTDVDGNIVETWEGIRIRVAHCKRDGSNVLAADTHNRIRNYCFEDLVERTIVKEESSLIYFCVDKNEQYALCTVARQGLHLWDLKTGTLVRRYRGAAQGYYTIFSCFGGVNERYLASGSEEGNVYVWQREIEEAIAVLKGHTNVVNAASWNPADPSMLASCSDDGTVRIWAPAGFRQQGASVT